MGERLRLSPIFDFSRKVLFRHRRSSSQCKPDHDGTESTRIDTTQGISNGRHDTHYAHGVGPSDEDLVAFLTAVWFVRYFYLVTNYFNPGVILAGAAM